jgi:hypothetical protein
VIIGTMEQRLKIDKTARASFKYKKLQLLITDSDQYSRLEKEKIAVEDN